MFLELSRILNAAPLELLAQALGESLDAMSRVAGYRDGVEESARVASPAVRLAIESLLYNQDETT